MTLCLLPFHFNYAQVVEIIPLIANVKNNVNNSR